MARSLLAQMLFAGLCCGMAAGQVSPSTQPAQVSGREVCHFGQVAIGSLSPAIGLAWSARHPDVLLLRGEAGGLWGFDHATRHWSCLTDNIPFQWRDLLSIDAVAVHPDDPDRILFAGGTRMGGSQDLLRTEDGGKTWLRFNLRNKANRPVGIDATGENRSAGERLVYDRNKPEIVFFATRNDGLLTSHDGGKSWDEVAAFTERGKPWAGLSFVAGDFSAGTSGQPTRRWYVGVAPDRTRGVRGGLFVTNDAGQSWDRIENGPGMLSATATPIRGSVASDGTIYITTVGAGVWWGKGGQWINITPPEGRGKAFVGLDVDERNPARVVVAQAGAPDGPVFYYSQDAGRDWVRYAFDAEKPEESNLKPDGLPPWAMVDGRPVWGGTSFAVHFDPADTTRALLLSRSGISAISGIGSRQAIATPLGRGREQTTVGRIIVPTAGACLISGGPEVGGFRHENCENPPVRRIGRLENEADVSIRTSARTFQDVFDMDAQPGRPMRIVLTGGWQWNQSGEALYSTDNGKTFRAFPTRPFDRARFGRIAIGVDAENVVWAPLGDATTSVFFTLDNGATWFPSEGAPLGLIATEGNWSSYRGLSADRVLARTFYLYDRRDGSFYRSSDGGARFKRVASLPRQPGLNADWHRLEAAPWRGGDVWLALRDQGLLHSTDGGDSWVKLEGIAWAENVTFGKARRDGDYPAIYLLGQVAGEKAEASSSLCHLYRSDDGGQNWTRMSDDSMGLGSVASGFAGDMQNWGRVFIGTNARGIMVAEPAANR